jgi:predicted DNA-binding transcriptional regulator YafY
MNRTDRMLAIVLELQAHGARRAEDLAATFEVSKRTIYRDVQALCEAGVPLVAEPGRGYSLPPGYFLPPLRFSADEALMLLLGTDVMAGSFDAEYRAVAAGAARKIAGALPDERRAEVEALRGSLHFAPAGAGSPQRQAALRSLRGAILARQTVRLSYRARYGADMAGGAAEREVDPYGLAHIGDTWYLVGHCHLRGDLRNFRLDRIEAIAPLPRRFERPPGFRLQMPSDERPLLARALFAPAVAAWVREAPFFYTVAEEERPDGLLLTLRARRPDELLPWLLSWGGAVRVLEPPELRAQLAAAAAAILANHGDPEPRPGC